MLFGHSDRNNRSCGRAARAASLFLAAVFVLFAAALSSCSSGIKPVKATAGELKPVGRVAGHEVTFDELRYITMNVKADLEDKYGAGIWDDPAKAAEHRDELYALVKTGFESDYYAVVSMADEYYIGGADRMLSESAIKEAVAKSVDETAESCGGKKEYLAELAANYLNDRLYRFYLSCGECANELTIILKTDLGLLPSTPDDFDRYLHSDKFIRTNHIYIKDKTPERLELAKELAEQLKASDRPDLEIVLLKGKYCSDYTMTTTHGAYFARYTSDYGDEYEKTAFALKPGEVGEIVEGSDGYYVILRLEKEEDWINKNYADFCDDIVGSEFNSMLAEFKARLDFTYNDYGSGIDLVAMK